MTLGHARARAAIGLCPLDLVPAAPAAAYSVRKLLVGYTGAALRVRRSSDNTQQDIGFKGQILDTAAMLTFCGAGDGFVSVWYDQSGNANDASEAAANQPKIVAAGAAVTLGGRPTLQFVPAGGFVATAATTATSYTGALTIHSIVSVPDTAKYRFIASKFISASANAYEFRISTTGFPEFTQSGGSEVSVAGTTAVTTSTKMGLAAVRASSLGTLTHYRDGASAGSGTLGGTGPTATNVGIWVGSRSDVFSFFYDAQISELVLFASALTGPNLSAIYTSF